MTDIELIRSYVDPGDTDIMQALDRIEKNLKKGKVALYKIKYALYPPIRNSHSIVYHIVTKALENL